MSSSAGMIATPAAPRTPAPDRSSASGAGAARAFYAIAALFVLLHLQQVTLTGRLVGETDGPALKPYHAFLILLGVIGWRRALPRFPRVAVWYVAWMVLLSIVVGIATGHIAPMIGNVVIAAYSAVVGAWLAETAGRERTHQALRLGSVVLLLATLGKLVLFRGAILEYLSAPFGHPLVPTFVGGGPNLEATWVVLAACFWIGRRGFLPFWFGAMAISACYVSRTALMLGGLIALVAWWELRTRAPARWRRVTVVSAAIGSVVVLAGIAQFERMPLASIISSRFSTIGEEPGSLGRLTLWYGARDVLAAAPWGVGLGQSIPAVERSLGTSVPEDNLHNLYLQQAVDGGVIGGLLFIALAMAVVAQAHRARWSEPTWNFTVAYLAAGLLQFRGGDTISWCVFGMAVAFTAPRASDPAPTLSDSLPAPRLTT